MSPAVTATTKPRLWVAATHSTLHHRRRAHRLGGSLGGTCLAPVASIGEESPMALALQSRPASAVDRWIRMVVAVTEADDDPPTLGEWARLIAASEGSVRLYCYTAGMRPKASLDFARLLRVIRRSTDGEWAPALWLAAADARTLDALLARGGFRLRGERRARTVANLISRQRLIPAANPVLAVLAARLNQAPLAQACGPSVDNFVSSCLGARVESMYRSGRENET